MERSIFSPETGFSRVMNRLWDLIFLSLLWLVFSVPVVTVGASSAAAYYTAAKTLRRKEGTVFASFWSSFRLNLKQGVLFSMIFLLLLALLTLNVVGMWGSEAPMDRFFLYVQYVLALLLLGIFEFFYACLSRFSDSLAALFKRALLMAFRHLPVTILLLLLDALLLLAGYLMPWSIFLFPGVFLYGKTYLLEPLLRRYSPLPEEGSEESKKWYYQ